MKKSLFIILLIASLKSLLSFAESKPEWQRIKNITVLPGKVVVVSISKNTVDLDIMVRQGVELISIQNGPEERDGIEYIYLTANNIAANYDLFIRKAYVANYTLKYDIHIFPNDVISQSEAVYKVLYEVSQLWYQENRVLREDAIIKLSKILKSEDHTQSVFESMHLTYVFMLLGSGKLQDAYSHSAYLLSGFKNVYNKFTLKLYWVQAQVKLLLYKPSEAYDLFSELINYLSDGNLPDSSWNLILENMRGDYGLSRILMSHHIEQDQANMLEEGKLEIEKSLRMMAIENDQKLHAKLLNNLWSYYASVKNFKEAEKVLLLALKYQNESGLDEGIISIYNHLALTYRPIGRIGEALQYLREALNSFNVNTEESVIAATYTNMAKTYEAVGEYNTTLDYYKKSLDTYSKMGSEYGQAVVRYGLGKVARQLGDVDMAMREHLYALEYFSKKTTKDKVSILVELSKNAFSLGDKILQNKYIDELRKLSKKMNYAERGKIDSLLLLARVCLDNYENCNFHELIREIESIKNLSHIQLLELNQLLIKYYHSVHDVLRIKEFGDASLKLIRDFHNQLDTFRYGIRWVDKTNNFLSYYIYILLQYDQLQLIERVFQIIEENYAVNLRLNRLRYKQSHFNSDLEKDKHLSLLWEKLIKIQNLAVSSSSTNKKIHETYIIQANKAREEYLSYIPQPDTSVVNLKNLSIYDVQNMIENDEILIRYYVQSNISFAFVITKNEWSIKTLPSKADLTESVNSLIVAVNNRKNITRYLLGDLDKLLPHDILSAGSYKKLIIVPDGMLFKMPFSVINIASDKSYSPLIREYEIVSTYSISEYFSSKVKSVENDKLDISIFADPIFDYRNKSLEQVNVDEMSDFYNWSKSLRRLSWTSREANNLKKLFLNNRSIVFSDYKATRANFWTESVRNSKVLHIATHGYFNANSLENSGIVLSVVDENRNSTPGFVTLTELMNYRFNNELVVINGCSTSLGMQSAGEGMVSIARGIIAQGANNVISTLWPVSDKASAKFMSLFYKHLLQVNFVDKALRGAQLELRSNSRYHDPFYWAAYILTTVNSDQSLVFSHSKP